MNKKYSLLLPLGLSILAGIIYLLTAAPSMAWEDALNLADASITFGISDPPAPLYVFLGHFFTLLPVGSDIFRLQIFSTLLAAASLFLLYRLILWITTNFVEKKADTHHTEHLSSALKKPNNLNLALAAIFGVLSLAFSYEFWSQAQNTEKYTLESLLELLVLVLITITLSTRKKIFPIFLTVFFLLGISLGTDPVVLSFFPSVIIILWQKKREFTIPQFLLLGTVGLAGVILVYSYLPIMSAQNPFLNWGRPTDLGSTIAVATGQGFNNSTNGFTGSVTVFLSSAWHFFVMLWIDFTPVILPFIFLGGWFLWKKSRNLFWLLFLIIATNFVLSTLYLSGNQDAWYVLPDVSFAIFAGLGYFWLMQKLNSKWFIYLLFLLSLTPLIYWWTGLDRSGWRINNDYTYNMYNPIQAPAIIFGGADLFVDNSYYIHDVSGFKPNIIPVLVQEFYINNVYRQNLQITSHIQIPDIAKYEPLTADNYSAFVNDFFAMNMPNYKIYIDYPAFNTSYPGVLVRPDGTASFILDTRRFKLIPAGLAYEVVPQNSTQQPNLQDFNYQFSNGFPQNKPVIEEKIYNDQLNNLVNQYTLSYITIGNYLSQKGNLNQAISYYQKGYEMDPTNGAILSTLGLYHINHNEPTQALIYFKQGAQTYPDDPNWIFSMAIAYGERGDGTQAIPLLQQVISHTPSGSPLNAKATAVLTKLESAPTQN